MVGSAGGMIAKADPALASEMRQHAAEILAAADGIISDLSGE